VRTLLRFARGGFAALAVLIGGLLSLLIVWWSLWSLVTPECGTDPDNAVARVTYQAGAIVLAVSVVAVSIVVLVVSRRLTARGRTYLAVAYPGMAVATWVIVSALTSAVLGLTSASGPTASCF